MTDKAGDLDAQRLRGYRLRPSGAAADTVAHAPVTVDMLLGSPVPLKRFVRPRLSPALAVVLAADVPAGSEREAVHIAIGGSFLALELRAGDTDGGFVVGERLLQVPLDGVLGLYLAGRLVSETPLEALGSPTQRLAWLADEVGGLSAGQVVFLGSASSEAARPGTVELWGPAWSALVATLDEAEN